MIRESSGMMDASAADASSIATTTATAQQPVGKTWKAATDFEAMTIGQLLEPMFDTVDTSKGMFGGGVGEATIRPMLVTEMAKQLETNGGFGLASSIYRQMLAIQEKSR